MRLRAKRFEEVFQHSRAPTVSKMIRWVRGCAFGSARAIHDAAEPAGPRVRGGVYMPTKSPVKHVGTAPAHHLRGASNGTPSAYFVSRKINRTRRPLWRKKEPVTRVQQIYKTTKARSQFSRWVSRYTDFEFCPRIRFPHGLRP